MIRMFSSFYPEPRHGRAGELKECLRRNLALPDFDFVCVLLERTESLFPDDPQLLTRQIPHRPRYDDFFQWANELVESEEDISVICNSDIYFDTSIFWLAKRIKSNQCAALSRWDVQPDGSAQLFERNDSQDVWVIRGKIRPIVADFCMGIPRCDNRILYELRAAGYEVINPAFSVRAFHLHAGERGEYPAEIRGLHVEPPYAYLWPHNLMSLPATVLHRVGHPEIPLGWRFDRRRLQRSLPWRALNKLTSRKASGETRVVRAETVGEAPSPDQGQAGHVGCNDSHSTRENDR